MQEGIHNDISILGQKLSILIDCSVRCTGLLFICKSHEAKFSVEALRNSRDWGWALVIHNTRKEAKV